MNGVVGNNVVVTLEGVPINNPLDGSVEWGAIPFDVRDVERIEVVRGPVSAVYGANAYTGVVNIVTYRGYGRLPVWGARASGTVDDRGQAAGQVSFRWTRHDEHREISVLGVGGYDDIFARAELGSNPALMNAGMLGRIGLDLGGGRFEAQIGFAALRRSSLEHLSLARVPEWRNVTTARLQYTTPELPGVLGPMAIWARALDHRVPNSSADATNGFSYRGTNALRSNLGFDLPLNFHRTFQATVGGELDLDAVRASYIVGGDDGLLRLGYGAYVQAHYDPHSRVSISGAVRVDRPTVDPTPLLSYRAAAVYHTDTLSVRVSASSSFRAPTYVERLGRFVDPAQGIIILEGSELNAPRNTSFEAGVTYSPRVNVTMGGSVYASRLSSLVLEDFFTIPRKSFVSDGRERWLGGIEGEVAIHLLDALQVEASGSAIYYFTDVVGDPATVAEADQNSLYTASLRLRGAVRGDRLHYGGGVSFASKRSFSGAVGVPWVFTQQNFEPIVLIDAMLEHVLRTRIPIWVFGRIQANPLGRTESSFLPGASQVGTSFTLGIEVRRD
jgi:outer membrane receptor protein involved in Fe transport